MQFLDRTGVGTLWSICKEKFALTGHTHNYAGSGSPGGPANSAIGVVDYNNTDKTIQIGYSGAGISGDEIKYIAGYTSGGGVNAKIKDVSKDALKSWLGLGSLAYNSSIDWSQISGFPMASVTTLGGIKVSGSIGNTDHSKYWPIYVDSNGVVRTIITGLDRTRDGNIESIKVQDLKAYANYGVSGIEINDGYGEISNITLPSRSGTLAVLGDIPNVSKLCKFNFINSISECKSDRINFLIFNEGYTIEIDPLNDSENGIILFIFTKVDVYIKNKSSYWYHGENRVSKGDNFTLSSGRLLLLTVNKAEIHTFTFN